ncbi:MAG TPA: hypothetical protein VMH82_04515 [Myxococcota bacterium]|nr:hypothetical protein [Myxococcota bacterium]
MARLSTAWIALLRIAFVVLALTSVGRVSKAHARVATPAVSTHDASWTASSQTSEGDEDDGGDDDDDSDDDSGE